MKISFRKGLGFGLTSGIITTLGLIVGLNFSTSSVKIVIGGIIIIAVADSLSDALGIHVSEEAESKHSIKEVWESTISTFMSKFFTALTFIIPILLLPLNYAVIISIIWGLIIIIILSFYIAWHNNAKPAKIIFEHLLIAMIVIIATYYIGIFVARYFN